MASRARQRADLTGPADPEAGGTTAAFPVAVRILILSSFLLLAIYTAFAIRRMDNPELGPETAGGLHAAAALTVARAETEAVRLRLSALSAAQRLQRTADRPMDAAETAFRLAQPGALGAAVVGEDGVVAVAGGDEARALSWVPAAAAAQASEQSIWLGRPGGGPGEARPSWPPAPPPAGVPTPS